MGKLCAKEKKTVKVWKLEYPKGGRKIRTKTLALQSTEKNIAIVFRKEKNKSDAGAVLKPGTSMTPIGKKKGGIPLKGMVSRFQNYEGKPSTPAIEKKIGGQRKVTWQKDGARIKKGKKPKVSGVTQKGGEGELTLTR